MHLETYLGQQVRHYIPAILLDFHGSVGVSISKHLEPFVDLKEERFLHDICGYVTARIKQEIFERYDTAQVKPRILRGSWEEHIAGYFDQGDRAIELKERIDKCSVFKR